MNEHDVHVILMAGGRGERGFRQFLPGQRR